MTTVTSTTVSVLLIEDTPSLQIVYRSVLTAAGHQVRVAATATEGMEAFETEPVPVVVLDLVLPDRDGLTLMQDILRLRPETQVIVITANGSINKAVEAMRAGAHEFLVKPFEEARLLSAIENATGPKESRKPRAVLRPAKPSLTTRAFIGSSEPMKRIETKIASVARSMATVFITGESGTGKELCAVAVHQSSNRANGPFIALNCGAIPQDLLESEVFGHIKGSFTGAISDKPGAAAAADGGTLFLDEICEMAPALQTKLLRFLQTSTVQPVGAVRPRKVNVRIVCATNRDPLDAVRRGHFREDLYYRLYVVPIHMPPLRQRGDDVIEIAEAALARFAEEEGRDFQGLSPEVISLFKRLPWPGNVRQVLNVIRNVAVLHEGGVVTTDMLPENLSEDLVQPGPDDRPAQIEVRGPEVYVNKTLAQIEREAIETTLARLNGSVTRAARVLDVSPSTLYRKIEAWQKPT